MTIDRHIDLLALLYTVSAVVAGLAAAALVPLGLSAAVLLQTGQSPHLAARIATVVFFVSALLLLAFAAFTLGTARGLRRTERWSRTAALALAVVNLFVPPFGTALGLYAGWVLLQQPAREVFGRA